MKRVWEINLYHEPMNTDDGWLWNWQDLFESCDNLQDAYKTARKEIPDFEYVLYFKRLICGYLYSVYERQAIREKATNDFGLINKQIFLNKNARNKAQKIVKRAVKKFFSSFNKLGSRNMQNFIKLQILPLVKTILHKKDYKRFKVWLTHTL